MSKIQNMPHWSWWTRADTRLTVWLRPHSSYDFSHTIRWVSALVLLGYNFCILSFGWFKNAYFRYECQFWPKTYLYWLFLCLELLFWYLSLVLNPKVAENAHFNKYPSNINKKQPWEVAGIFEDEESKKLVMSVERFQIQAVWKWNY